MTIIVQGGALCEGQAAGVGHIGYKNIYVDPLATVSASTEDTGFEKENAIDGFGYDWWKPTATGDSWIKASFAADQSADYAAIWGHDLADHGSSIKIQYSDDDAIWNDAASVTPSDNTVIFLFFTSASAKYWRVLVTSPTTIPVIAGVQIGDALTLPHNMEIGFEVPSMAPRIELKTAVSESGVFLGGSQVNKGISSEFTLTQIDPSFVRSEWEPFLEHAQTPKPFVFSWDSTNHNAEAVLGWLTGESVPKPSYSHSLYMQISLSFEGHL